MLLAYFGPETVLPLTSLLAGVAGVFLMFGRAILGVARRAFRVLRPGKPGAVVPASQPAGKRLRADRPDASASASQPTTAHAKPATPSAHVRA